MTQTNAPDSNQKVQNDAGLFTSPWFVYLQQIYKALRAKFQLSLSGMLSVSTESESNSGSGETDLISYLLDNNTLANNGDCLTIKLWGVFAANANNKTLKLKFGSQTILDTGAIAANGGSWEINATIIRKSPTTQEISSLIVSSNSSVVGSATRTAGTQDCSTDLTIVCTGQGSSSSDIVQYALIIGLTPND